MKVLLLDTNEAYVKRFAQYLGKKTDMQVSVCNNLEACKKMLAAEHFQIVLFDAEFDSANPEDYRKKMTAFAFISGVKDTIKETPTIYKYSSVSTIYAELMQIYAEHTQHQLKSEDETEGENRGTEVISFFPVSGGAGSSTMAMAAAIALARKDKVMYLNLEQRHAEMLLFSASGKKTITDVVATLRTNYQVKEAKKLLESVIRHDEKYSSGNIDFIQGYLNIGDCLGLTPAVVETLLTVLRKQFQYRYIIVDADFIIGDVLRKMITCSDKIVLVSTGSDTANAKIDGIHRYLEIVEREADKMPKKYLLLNQFYGLRSEEAIVRDMTVIGRFGRYRAEDHSLLSTEGVVSQILAKENAFQELV